MTGPSDMVALLGVATRDDIETTRDHLRAIESRGFSRGRDLLSALDVLLKETKEEADPSEEEPAR